MKKLLFITSIFLLSLTGCSSSDNNTDTAKDIAQTTIEQNIDTVTPTITDAPEPSDNQNEITTPETSEDNITKIISGENSWAIEVHNPLAVKDDSDYFLKVRVKTKEKTKYLVKNSIMPSSTYNLEVLDVLMNNVDNKTIPKNIKLAVNGGVVSMQDYINILDDDTKKKVNADKLTKKELKENVLINDESYYELEQHNEYYIFVIDLTDDESYKGYYGMPAGGYGVFEYVDGKYINVLTGRSLDI